eukprot:CAMPEP_0185812882 /NCGR_PEP_ID=MMETSP1322-20130828/10163_1 /TAXON_ID=265543 /ORGANISM="Minutocellus polymorphus, Strain RCC2270" /LENGTH=51 /DNA_ID=CAMNT_0028509473 /DNA_START=69 /DNA_END=222 /DNA_ORIENTATION=-
MTGTAGLGDATVDGKGSAVRSSGPMTPDVPAAEAAPVKAWAVTRTERMVHM